MSVAPRAVIVTRPTEYELMLRQHGTRQQVAFFLEGRGRDLGELDRRHEHQRNALGAVARAIPLDWRRADVDRGDLGRWLFGPEDVVVAVGQDGLVANVAKYLHGQPVVGVDPEPGRNAGVLVRHRPETIGDLLTRVVEADQHVAIEQRAMVELTVDDGRALRALNEVFVGHPSHQSARYTVAWKGREEPQSSSGVVVGTGTGATGWCRSLWIERPREWALPDPTSTDLAWFVREAWPSPMTGATLVDGLMARRDRLELTVRSDTLVAFGDGIESDRLELTWGQSATVGVAGEALRLVV
jgi:NAD kinase